MINHSEVIHKGMSKYIGVAEIPGPENNPVIMGFYRAAGFKDIRSETTPWCAAVMNAVLYENGYKGTNSLLAKSFLDYGEPVVTPKKGDIVVLDRGTQSWQGHVTVFDSWDNQYVYCIGGNQGNAVNRSRYPRKSVRGFRRVTDEQLLDDTQRTVEIPEDIDIPSDVTSKKKTTKRPSVKDLAPPAAVGVTSIGATLAVFKDPVVILGLTIAFTLGLLVGYLVGRKLSRP